MKHRNYSVTDYKELVEDRLRTIQKAYGYYQQKLEGNSIFFSMLMRTSAKYLYDLSVKAAELSVVYKQESERLLYAQLLNTMQQSYMRSSYNGAGLLFETLDKNFLFTSPSKLARFDHKLNSDAPLDFVFRTYSDIR